MRAAAAISILLLLSGGIAVAQAGAAPPAFLSRPTPDEPCMGQYEKFCSAVESGAGRKLYCMLGHLHQLPTLCRNRIQYMYKLESDQAVKMHMTVSQFMAWGQAMAGQSDEHHVSIKIKPEGQAPAPATQPQPPAPSKSQPK